MNNSVYNRRNTVRRERQQQKLDSGSLKARFPEVASVVINMTYSQQGLQKPLPRIVNFFPDSQAFFRIDCLHRECVAGGFDLTRVITEMIRDRRKTAKGDLSCEGDYPSAGHSVIVYEVAIQYI
ncbi:MAG: hypothetical protein P8013_06315 [Candidatus Sulfobium sp.]|jgi:hypothetical protein